MMTHTDCSVHVTAGVAVVVALRSPRITTTVYRIAQFEFTYVNYLITSNIEVKACPRRNWIESKLYWTRSIIENWSTRLSYMLFIRCTLWRMLEANLCKVLNWAITKCYAILLLVGKKLMLLRSTNLWIIIIIIIIKLDL